VPARALAPLLLALAVAAGVAFEARRGESPAISVLEGRVVRIHDGDTLSFQAGAATQRVRLAQIDAPEQGQPWGRRARQALARLAEERDARLVVVDRDDYGRAVGDLYIGELFVNEALVREGHAWAYPRYVRSPGIVPAEDEARRAGRGLWRLPAAERQPPWEWRRQHPRRR
jgi:endonuclease YncB( thermonuclease family)